MAIWGSSRCVGQIHEKRIRIPSRLHAAFLVVFADLGFDPVKPRRMPRNVCFQGDVQPAQFAAIVLDRRVVFMLGYLLDGYSESLYIFAQGQVFAPKVTEGEGLAHAAVAGFEDLAQRRMRIQVDRDRGQIVDVRVWLFPPWAMVAVGMGSHNRHIMSMGAVG